jgi:hypothetical protein
MGSVDKLFLVWHSERTLPRLPMKVKSLKAIVKHLSQGKDSRIAFCDTGIVGFSSSTEIYHSAFKNSEKPFSLSIKQVEGIIQLFEPDEDVSIKYVNYSGFATFETPSAMVTIACQNFNPIDINETPLVEKFYASLADFKGTFAMAEKCRKPAEDAIALENILVQPGVIAATDGHVLYQTANPSMDEIDWQLSGILLDQVFSKRVKNLTGEVRLKVYETYTVFEHREEKIVVRCDQSFRYPRVDRLIPKVFAHKFKVRRPTLMSLFRQSDSLSAPLWIMTFHEDNRIEVVCADFQGKRTRIEEFPCKSSHNFKFAIDSRKIRAYVENCSPDSMIEFSSNAEYEAIVLNQGCGIEEEFLLVMPVNIRD